MEVYLVSTRAAVRWDAFGCWECRGHPQVLNFVGVCAFRCDGAAGSAGIGVCVGMVDAFDLPDGILF